MTADVIVREASTESDYEQFGSLVRQYVEDSRDRYKDDPWIVDLAFSYQSLEQELKNISQAYGPPIGRTFLSVYQGDTVGCGAYRRLSDGSCEIKRMFVSPKFRRNGAGKRILLQLISSAQADGYKLIKLDSGSLNTVAHALYRSHGFADCKSYIDYPKELMPRMVFMELDLSRAR